MSTEIETKMMDHTATEFWGGDKRGVCVQITAAEMKHIHESGIEQLQEEGFIQLTMEEAAALCNTLARFISEEAKRRQSLLKEQIEKLKGLEKTVFREVADFSPEMFEAQLVVFDYVAKFCPKVRS